MKHVAIQNTVAKFKEMHATDYTPLDSRTATIERLNLCRRPTRRGTKAGTRRFKPITRVASRLCQEVSHVGKQTGVNNANLIQLTSRATGDGTSMVRSSPDLRAKFALINARSIRNKALLVRTGCRRHDGNMARR